MNKGIIKRIAVILIVTLLIGLISACADSDAPLRVLVALYDMNEQREELDPFDKEPTKATYDGKILVQSEAGWLFSITGDELEPILTERVLYVLLSPDGTKIAYTTNPREYGVEGNMFIMNADGTDSNQLTFSDDGAYCADFSPDGTQILYVSGEDLSREIYSMNIDGTGVRQLTHDSKFGEYSSPYPQYSPDGSLIAYFNRPYIWIMNADGSDPGSFTFDDIDGSSPSFMPDGVGLIFSSSYQVYLTDIYGSELRQLTVGNGSKEGLCVSPDGDKLLMLSELDWRFHGSQENICIMDSDGYNQVCLLEWGAFPDDSIESISYSPDGSMIMFCAEGSVYLMNADGSGLNKLTDGEIITVRAKFFPPAR